MKKNVVSLGLVLALILGATALGAASVRSRLKQTVLGLMTRAAPEAAPPPPSVRDIRHQMDRIACEQTARFVIERMPKVRALRDKFALFDHSLAAVDPK